MLIHFHETWKWKKAIGEINVQEPHWLRKTDSRVIKKTNCWKVTWIYTSHCQSSTQLFTQKEQVGLSCQGNISLIHPCSYFLSTGVFPISQTSSCVFLLYLFWSQRNWCVSWIVIKSHLFCFGYVCVSLFGLQLYLVLCKSTSEGKKDVRWRSFCTRCLDGMQLWHCRFIPPPSLCFSSSKNASRLSQCQHICKL